MPQPPEDSLASPEPAPSSTLDATVDSITLGMAWVSAAVVVWGFFLPWVTIEAGRTKPVKAAKAATHKAASDLDDALNQIFGFAKNGVHDAERSVTGPIAGVRIPRLANARGTQRVLELVEAVTKKRQREQIGRESWLVYLVPGIALVFAALLTLLCRARLACWGLALLAAAVPAAGTWKLLTTKVTGIGFAYGLWLSLAAYLGVAWAALAFACPPLSTPLRRWCGQSRQGACEEVPLRLTD